MFNINQLHSIPQFLRTNFQEVNYNERAFYYHKGEKKQIRSAILPSRLM